MLLGRSSVTLRRGGLLPLLIWRVRHTGVAPCCGLLECTVVEHGALDLGRQWLRVDERNRFLRLVVRAAKMGIWCRMAWVLLLLLILLWWYIDITMGEGKLWWLLLHVDVHGLLLVVVVMRILGLWGVYDGVILWCMRYLDSMVKRI